MYDALSVLDCTPQVLLTRYWNAMTFPKRRQVTRIQSTQVHVDGRKAVAEWSVVCIVACLCAQARATYICYSALGGIVV